MFRIEDFARFTRVSVALLRHYDELGLLTPSHLDVATGVGFYRADQLPRLHRILLLRDLGYTLDDIDGLLRATDSPEFDEVFTAQERRLVEALARTQAQLKAVRSRRALITDDALATDVAIRPVPSLLVATLSGGIGADVGEMFFALERYVRDHHARAHRPPLALLPEPDDETIRVAVPLARPIPTDGPIDVGFLDPVARMACVIHHGGPAGLPGVLQRILRWLERTGERPGGPIREVYLRSGAEGELEPPATEPVDDRAGLVTEVQVPLTTTA
jgi:DNA-binding transcriptional MerR regulator